MFYRKLGQNRSAVRTGRGLIERDLAKRLLILAKSATKSAQWSASAGGLALLDFPGRRRYVTGRFRRCVKWLRIARLASASRIARTVEPQIGRACNPPN